MSPRPKKPRNCCRTLRESGLIIFKPAGTPMDELKQVLLPPDEIEALHLCDSLGLTQQEAGERMGISRGTVQRLVVSGRKRLIDALLRQDALLLQAKDSSVASEPGEIQD